MNAKMQPFWWYIPMNCQAVKDCLEGDYSDWTLQWTKNCLTDWTLSYVMRISMMQYSEANDVIIVMATDNGEFVTVKLSSGELILKLDFWSSPFNKNGLVSLLNKYFMHMIRDYVNLKANLVIYKDCVPLVTLDLTSILGWAWNASIQHHCFSTDGKYILISNESTGDIALFKGS